MLENINTYNINGKKIVCSIQEPFLDDLIKIFINKKINKNYKIAVAVNNVLVEKYKWKKRKISLNDKIQIVTPFFGG